MNIAEKNSIVFPRLHPIAQAFRAVSIVRAPMLVAILTALALSLPDQTLEIYRVLAEDSEAEGLLHLLPLFLAFAATVFALWYFPWSLIRIQTAQVDDLAPATRFLLRGLPGLCSAAVSLGLGVGLLRASSNASWQSIPDSVFLKLPELDELRQAVEASQGTTFVAGAACLVISALIFFLAWYFGPTPDAKTEGANRRTLALFSFPVALIACGLVALQIWRIVESPVALPQKIGAMPIFLEFVILLAYFSSFLTARLDKFRIPALTTIFVLALVFSAADLNDNHRIETKTATVGKLPTDLDAFTKWYNSRNDRSYFEDKGLPYPVFIVSAAGGGLYAAYHTATVLSRLQDRCPNFAQHTFAISAVSGGSLGAAAFSSIAKVKAPNETWKGCQFGPSKKGPFEDQAQSILDTDFLAPIVASALFPDFLQRFLPHPIDSFSRAKSFDASLEQSWSRVAAGKPEYTDKENPFASPYLEQWNPKDSAPALVLNTTHVGFGYRAIFAPFYLATHTLEYSNIWNFYELLFDQKQHLSVASDLKLSTAVGLSARFPWITPAGMLVSESPWGEKVKFRFVDGGLFENSGVETATDLVVRLRHFERPLTSDEKLGKTGRPYIRLHVLPIDGITKLLPSHDPLGLAFGEMLSPIRTMLRTRERRGTLAWYRWLTGHRWEHRGCGFATDGLCNFTGSTLNYSDFRIPLGWQLSSISRYLIEREAGYAHRTAAWEEESYDLNSYEPKARIFGLLQENDEYACNAQHILHGVTEEMLNRMRPPRGSIVTNTAELPDKERMLCSK
jgi:hypothetical protein